jgi:LPXTG-site transpeptidase (sortase) family protein
MHRIYLVLKITFIFVLLAGQSFWVKLSSVNAAPENRENALSFPAQMNKSFTPISIVAGETSVLSVTIYNPNSFPLTSAHYHDIFPSGISLANPVGVTNTCGGTVTDDSLNPPAPGGTYFRLNNGTVPAQVGATPGQCTVTVNVTSTTPGNLINTIAANELTSEGDDNGTTVPVTNTTPASATLQVSPVTSPSLSKSFSPNTVFSGQSSGLTIRINNNDTDTNLTGATYTDTLPSGLIIDTPNGLTIANCGVGAIVTAPDGGTAITLSNGTVTPSLDCLVTVNVTGASGAYLLANGTANTIPAGPGGLGSLRTTQGVTNTTPAQAELTIQPVGIAKSFAPGTVDAGDTSMLTITLLNPTSAAYTGVSITDNLTTMGPGFTITGAPTSNTCGGTINAPIGGTSIALTGGAIPASATPPTPLGTCDIVIPVLSPLTSTGGTAINTIPANTLTAVQPVTNFQPASASLVINRALVGTKTYSPLSIVLGGTSTVTITLTNRSSTPITGVTFTDTLPANLTVSGTPTTPQCGGTVSTPATDQVSLTGGTIPADGNCTVVFDVTSNTAGTYDNSVALNSITNTQGIGHAAFSTNPDLVVVNSTTLPVGLTKTFQTNPVQPGQASRLRIRVIAPVDTSISGINITDNLPSGLVIATPNPPTIPNPTENCPGGTLTAVAGTSVITFTNLVTNVLAAGTGCNIDVWVTSLAPNSYTNTIPASAVTTFQGRTNLNPASDALNVTSLIMSKAFYPTAVQANGLSTITITLQNTTASNLINVSLTDNFPGSAANGLRVAPVPNATTTCGSGTVTATPGSAIISMTGGTIPAQVGGVPGLCTISVDVRGTDSTPATPTTRTNTIPAANVSGTVQNTGATISPLAQAQAVLSIEPLSIGVVKGFNPLTVFGGSSSTLSIELVNPNNTSLSGISFTDNMPTGMLIATPPDLNVGTCGGTLTGVPGAATFSFSGGSLLASSNCTLTLSATMSVNGNLTNTIGAGAVTTFNGVTNPDPASATLTNLPGASVSKSFAPNPVFAGDFSILTITIQNTGNIDLTGMGLVDDLPGTLPAGLAVAGGSAPAPVNNCNGTLAANPGNQIIQLTEGSLLGSASCTLVIPVTSTVAGNYQNTIPIGSLTNNEGASNNSPATDTLVVNSSVFQSLGDYVWNDFNLNGVQDAGEPGISNVTVNLYDASNVLVATELTDSNGHYLFGNLTTGDYYVEFILPSGYNFSPQDQGADDTLDSDANTTTGRTVTTTLTSGENDLTWDAGIVQLASLGDFVWNDLDADGIQEASETGISGVTVRLLDSGGTMLATTTTNASGLYLFNNLTPGAYSVEFVLPSGYNFSPQDQGVDNAADSDANTTTGRTIITTLASGENDMTWDAGMHQHASLGDFVWNDLNANGIQNAGETGISNVTVNLYTGAGSLQNTTTTDASGHYLFSDLNPGNYYVEFVLPAGYVYSPQDQGADDALDSDANITSGLTSTTSLIPGENDLTWDAGLFTPEITVDKVVSAVVFTNPNVARMTYTITIGNPTSLPLDNVQATDDLQAAFGSAVSFTLINVTTSGLSENTSYNGISDINLLVGTDTLSAGASETITLIVEVDTGGTASSYTNTVDGSGQPPSGPRVTGTASATGPAFADPAVAKTADISQAMVGELVTFTITVTNNGNQTAANVSVTDPLPSNLDVITATSSPVGTVSIIAPRTVAVDIGNVDPGDVITILVTARVNGLGTPPIQNLVTLTTTTATDILSNNQASVPLTIITPLLPDTGFAPNRLTKIPLQPESKAYTAYDGLTLLIPTLKISLPIVGVPKTDDSWDVTWLEKQAGWLNGTAFPTWNGNSVITGHVYQSNGLPGPFVNLGNLKYSDQIIINAYGQDYIYEVRSVRNLKPGDAYKVLRHEELPWITLLTCKDYDPRTDTYRNRIAVRAVLVSVIDK